MSIGEVASNRSVSPPCRVQVERLLESRYGVGSVEVGGAVPRPLSWDERVDGVDIVELADGSTIRLKSNGQQNPPHPGWTLLLTSGDASSGYSWTLYGIPKGSAVVGECY